MASSGDEDDSGGSEVGCEECTNYAFALLDLEEEHQKATKRLARAEKYGGTLKHHIKAVAAKNDTLRAALRELQSRHDRLERDYRGLVEDAGTSTNARLRDVRKHQAEIIRTLQEKQRVLQHRVEQMTAVNDAKGAKLKEHRRHITELQSKLGKLTYRSNELESLMGLASKRRGAAATAAANASKRHVEEGMCIICLSQQACFAQRECGCLCFCDGCEPMFRESLTIQSAWSCPMCRTLNRSGRHLRIYNLPQVTVRDEPDGVGNLFDS